jgi:hypothetical protein
MKTENEIYQINKVTPKLSKWFKNQNMICSQILINYLKLEEKFTLVEYYVLAEKCKNLKTFKSNFDQMKNFGEKNHGKVFEKFDSKIKLWKPVENDVYIEYEKFKKANRSEL